MKVNVTIIIYDCTEAEADTRAEQFRDMAENLDLETLTIRYNKSLTDAPT